MITPDEIHNVSHTQFSIARHYGGCVHNGKEYVYFPDEDKLVRKDLLKKKKILTANYFNMKIQDLKLGDLIEINGHEYRYKGINKIRTPNLGAIPMIVFEPENKDFNDVHYDMRLLSRELKVHQDGKIEFK